MSAWSWLVDRERSFVVGLGGLVDLVTGSGSHTGLTRGQLVDAAGATGGQVGSALTFGASDVLADTARDAYNAVSGGIGNKLASLSTPLKWAVVGVGVVAVAVLAVQVKQILREVT